MNKKVISISREFGSGGREIARLLARELGIPFYDKEILANLISEKGMNEMSMENISDHINGSQYYLDVPLKNYVGQGGDIGFIALQERMYRKQEEVIKTLSKSPCVIVGRCSQYILKDCPQVLRVFVRADEEDRIKSIQQLYQLDVKEASEKMKDGNTKRANYFEYFTNRKWRSINNYDLVINSSKFTQEEIVKLIIQALNK